MLTAQELTFNAIRDYLEPKEQYHYLGQWVSPPLSISFWMYWSNNEKVRTSHFKKIGFSTICVDGHFFLSKNGLYGEIREQAYRELMNGGKSPTLSSIFQLAEEIENRAKQLIIQLRQDPASFDLLAETFSLYREAVFPWMACLIFDDALEDTISDKYSQEKSELEKIIPEVDYKQSLSTVDQRQLRIFKEELQRKNIGIPGITFDAIQKQDADLANDLVKYQKETEWIGTHHFWGEPRTMAGLLSEIISSTTSNQNKNRHAIPPSLVSVVDVIGKSSYWRLQLAEIMGKVTYLCRPALTKIGQQYGLSYDQVIYADQQEILDAAIHQIPLEKEKIHTRIPRFAMGVFNDASKINVLTGDAVDQLEDYFELKKALKGGANVIKGKIAHQGQVTGQVAVVLTPADMPKVREGMILVAPETTPDFLPVMKKAAAFITDRGGITSHAAIVARELGKPCIVGTKIATQVLKDGDSVEVDADKGIVMILKNTQG